MGTVRATVHAGICGFVSEITAHSDDEQEVHFTITSPCANIQGIAAALPRSVDAYAEMGTGHDGAIWQAVRESPRRACSGCIVPAALQKAMQVASGLALPGDASIALAHVEG